jgi:hypothetical protein
MTDDNHPIRPPHELVQQWVSLACENEGYETWQDLATQAARWGADQELEACCQEVHDWYGNGNRLRAVRRPRPPSLKEQALALLDKAEDPSWDINDFTIVRRALEQLDD